MIVGIETGYICFLREDQINLEENDCMVQCYLYCYSLYKYIILNH